MKGIFSIATFVALAAALVSSAPLTRRDPISVPADYFEIISEAEPDTTFGPTQIPVISVVDGSNEVDSFVSFSIPSSITLSSTSTCQFFLTGVTADSGSAVQLFSLGYPLVGDETFNTHPFYDQDEGQYSVDPTTGDSSPLYGGYVPCSSIMQFVIRPHFTDASITWTQSDTVGAFIEVTP
jgi:hypothetical protein